MNNFRRVAKNTFFLTISEIFLKAIGFLWVVFLARSLSVELFGRYSFVNSFISIFSFLPDLGVGLIVIREIAKNKEMAGVYLGNALVLNGIFAFCTMCIVFFASFILGYTYEVKVLIIIAAIILFVSTFRSVGIFYFDGMEKMNISAFLNSFNSLLLISFGFFALLLGFGLKGIFWGMLIGTIVSLLLTWNTVRAFVTPKFLLNPQLMKRLFLDGLPLGLASFASIVYTRIDTIILARLSGEYSAGIYNAAVPFSFALIGILNVPFIVAVYPALSRLSQESPERFIKAIKKSLLFIIAWSFPAALVISVLSPFVPFIFGPQYLSSVPILKVHIFMVPFISLSALLYKIMIVLGKQYMYLVITVIGAFLNIILNILLIAKYGILGSAYASVYTQMILFVVYLIAVYSIVLTKKMPNSLFKI